MGTILITGGGGFIGQETTKSLLERGHVVRILDTFSEQVHANPLEVQERLERDCEVIVGDICNYEVMCSALKGVKGVLHLAAETGVGQSMYEIEKHTLTNIQGTSVLLQALREHKGSVEKIVLASSRAVYGEGLYYCSHCEEHISTTPRVNSDLKAGRWEPLCAKCKTELISVATKESSKFLPGSVYAASKASQEYLVECVSNSLEVDFNFLRYFNVYGEGQALGNPYTGILTTFITQILGNKEISVYEDGKESRDFVHVNDVVRANVAALESSGVSGAYNIGSGVRTSILDMAKILSKICDYHRPPKITGEYRLGDIRHCFADTKLAEAELGFSAVIDIESGLNQFVDWAREQEVVDKTEVAYKELLDRGLLGVGSKS